MVKKASMSSFFLMVLCVIAISASGIAQSAFAAETVKIGYVDIRGALNESEAGKKAKIDLESLIKTKQTVIDEKGKAIEKLKADVEKQASVLSAEAKKTKEDEIERLMREYQRQAQDAQAEVKKKESELTVAILKELKEVVDKIGQEEDYLVIFENTDGVILYSKKELDITDKVIKKYNESSTAKQKSSK